MNFERPLMLVGTGSDVGKSVLCAGICRILSLRGHRPAPFKGQNMSNNSYVTKNGKEMGRAQVVQAEAAGVEPHVDMNPVLLKPGSNQNSQVIVNGVPVGNQSAYAYFQENNRQALLEKILEAFTRLRKEYAPIVMEGAGSISELNLRKRDITNMRLAKQTNAATYLVADIDKGGVFASVYGSIKLLPIEERKLIKGIIINKFRGDARLFEEGKTTLQKITGGIPVVGVVPYFDDIVIEQEDAASLTNTRNFKTNQGGKKMVKIVVLHLKRISNFTDFQALEHTPGVQLVYSTKPEDLRWADILILPGTKNTLEDLDDLRKQGLVPEIHAAVKEGKKIIGICGGFQMMGKVLHDPMAMESDKGSLPGLGLIPMETTMAKKKTTEQQSFYFRNNTKDTCKGYEIHMGKSKLLDPTVEPVNWLSNGAKEGAWMSDRCWGTYMHGILDNQEVLQQVLGIEKQEVYQGQTAAEYKNTQFNALASLLEQHLDIDYIVKTLQNKH